MRRVRNLIENKDLINTFKKLKIRVHLNKNSFKQASFFFYKYNNLSGFKQKNKHTHLYKYIFMGKFFLKKKSVGLDFFSVELLNFKKILMFIK